MNRQLSPVVTVLVGPVVGLVFGIFLAKELNLESGQGCLIGVLVGSLVSIIGHAAYWLSRDWRTVLEYAGSGFWIAAFFVVLGVLGALLKDGFAEGFDFSAVPLVFAPIATIGLGAGFVIGLCVDAFSQGFRRGWLTLGAVWGLMLGALVGYMAWVITTTYR